MMEPSRLTSEEFEVRFQDRTCSKERWIVVADYRASGKVKEKTEPRPGCVVSEIVPP